MNLESHHRGIGIANALAGSLAASVFAVAFLGLVACIAAADAQGSAQTVRPQAHLRSWDGAAGA